MKLLTFKIFENIYEDLFYLDFDFDKENEDVTLQHVFKHNLQYQFIETTLSNGGIINQIRVYGNFLNLRDYLIDFFEMENYEAMDYMSENAKKVKHNSIKLDKTNLKTGIFENFKYDQF